MRTIGPARGVPARWGPPPTRPAAVTDEIHIWRLDLDALDPDELSPYLSDDELARAARFRFEWDARRFIVCRGQLRRVIGRYVEVEPRELTFSYGGLGRPSVSHPVRSLVFNVSHSDGVALFAVGAGRSIGVDIERLRPVDPALLASVFLTPRESSALLSLSDPEMVQDSFFRYWTGKEATLKAVGRGLNRPAEDVELTIHPGQDPEMYRVGVGMPPVDRWCLREPDVGPAFRATVAAVGSDWRLRCWDAV
jgi:4'-phosphopantetheinyl transferase